MNPNLVDDREYRRGMILGLTLAEVLLLLLFLLMLALGSELIDLEEKLSSASDGSAAIENTSLKNKVQEGEDKLNQYKKLLPDIKLAAKLKLAFDAASKINPNDPPAALKKGIDLQIALANEGSSLDTTEEIIAKVSFLQEELQKTESENSALKSKHQVNENIDELFEQIVSSNEQDGKAETVSVLLETLEAIAGRFEEKNGKKPTADELRNYVENDLDVNDFSKSKWPPIINLSEANGHFFEIGSAALTTVFRKSLETEIPERLINLLQQYEVDTIEIIGHTDEQPIRGRKSNLDTTLLDAAKGGESEDYLSAADNAGLGMARSVSVMKILKKNPRLRDWDFIPLTGAQLIGSDGKLSLGAEGDIKERRRIEIRLRGSSGLIKGHSNN